MKIKDIIMLSFLKDRYLVIIILLALIGRLVPYIYITINSPERVFEGDSYLYHNIAINLIKHKSFSDASQSNGVAEYYGIPFKLSAFSKKLSYVPEGRRTPLYPAYLAAMYSIFGYNPCFVILFQILMGVFICILTYKLGTTLFNQKAGFIAGILMATDLSSIVYDNYLLTETLFTFIFIIFVWFMSNFLVTEKKNNLTFAGLFLGLSSLCKPISLYLFLPVSIIFFLKYKLKLKRLTLMYLIFIFMFFLTISPWIFRNYLMFNEAKLSSIGGYNLLFYQAAGMEAEKTGVDVKIIRKRLINEIKKIVIHEDLNSFEASQVCEKLAVSKIQKDIPTYFRAHLKGTINIFLGHSLEEFYYLLDKEYHSSSALSIFSETGNLSKALSLFFKGGYSLNMIFRINILILSFLIYLFMIYGAYKMIRDNKVISLFFIGVILYITLLPGPGGYARFRVPITPYIMLFAGYGLCVFMNMLGRRAAARSGVKPQQAKGSLPGLVDSVPKN